MDCVCSGLLCGGDNSFLPQIAFGDGCGSNPDRLVGNFHMQRVGIGVGINRDGLKPQFLRGADHAARDLTPVRD